MKPRLLSIAVAPLCALAAAPLLPTAADAASVQPKEGGYRALADFDFVRTNVDILDSQFDKQLARLRQDKSTLLIFYPSQPWSIPSQSLTR